MTPQSIFSKPPLKQDEEEQLVVALGKEPLLLKVLEQEQVDKAATR